MAGFDHPWFAEITEWFSPSTKNVNSEANAAIDAHSTAMLAAACIVAQSIDAHTKALESVAKAIRDGAEGAA